MGIGKIMTTGRPLKFETPELLQEQIDAFFDHCKKEDEQPIVEGLAIFLKTNKQTILNYAGREDYAPLIEDAKLRIAHSVMSRAMSGKINPTIAIWVSKNHYDYSDKRDVNLGGQVDNPLSMILKSLDGHSAGLPENI